ncbi:carboxypeptidase-like regulatory domain-containing protein [Marixanthomonas ophiurae]|uniref:Carboxypeptidase-like regulatory domain-containing protein n=1 Tax=Marixanthomonas ophiurae TaxID=387659 RepID=A0A3E1QAS6_9FLAO|nr:carboxypeptidase-like regulatory domain-containing protein [Marixanthomonas ophiurae]RFN59240.1 carboxypeptidase-like regulatory domain-containing protein [Marixanthomonas ophiurae]
MNIKSHLFRTLKNLLFFVGLIFFSTSLLSQEISGRVYDDTSVLPGVTVFNSNNKTAVVTNEDGAFTIKAAVNDTLQFQSSFHESQDKIITLAEYRTILIVELKQKVNTLDEVLLSGEEKEFDVEKYNADLSKQIENDIENNPFDYGKAPAGGGVNLLALVKLVISIFKKKPEEKIIYATQIDLIQLFEKDKFFTETLLENTLKIPKQYKNLFLDYCAAKQIEEALLIEENKFQLLDLLVVSSNEFRDIVKEYEANK